MREQNSNENETTNFEPHKNDVLCGRGGSINNHIGNENYRIFVNRKKKVYLTARFKREKRLIAASIVKEVRSLDPPGRFLAKDNRSGQWYDIGDLKARDKTSQALREGAPEIRKEMESDRKKQRNESKKDHDSDMDDSDNDSPSTVKDTSEVENNTSPMDTSWEKQRDETMQMAVARMNIHDEDPWKQQHHHSRSFHRNSKSPPYEYNPHHHHNISSQYPHVDPYAQNIDMDQGRDTWYPSRPPAHPHHNQHYDHGHIPSRDHIISPIKTQFSSHQPRVQFQEDHQRPNQPVYQHSAYDNNPTMPPPPPSLSNLRMPHEKYSNNVHNSEAYAERYAYNNRTNSPSFNRDKVHPQNHIWGPQNGQNTTAVGRRSEMEYKHKTHTNMSRPEEIYEYMNIASGARHTCPPSPMKTGERGFHHHNRRSEQINVKNKPQRSLAQAKRKQIVETRAEPQDWLCSSFFPTSFFGGDDASFCGFDLCSVNSLGGGSLCGVFIEDDPNRNNEIEIATRNQVLKEAKSWGSIRSRSTLGSMGSGDRDMFSVSSADKSFKSKGSDKGFHAVPHSHDDMQPLPHDDPAHFSFNWSWDGKKEETRTE